jgi:signal transduction histidine kinase
LWRIEVLDEGPGLAPDQLERIFGRFVRLQGPDGNADKGSGLGLPISRSIALLHGGKLSAANRGDRTGLCMTIELPVG